MPIEISSAGKNPAADTAQQFHTLLEAQMAEGFEFYRTETLSHFEPPGCLGFVNPRGVTRNFHIAVFRRAY